MTGFELGHGTTVVGHLAPGIATVDKHIGVWGVFWCATFLSGTYGLFGKCFISYHTIKGLFFLKEG